MQYNSKVNEVEDDIKQKGIPITAICIHGNPFLLY